MNDNEKWPRTSPGFNTTREAYEHQGATVDRIIERNTPTDDERDPAAEREEIARIIGGHIDVPVSSRLAIARSLQGNGFRRTEVPQPSDLSICECYRDGSEMVTCPRHTKPQGEPSSEVPEPSATPSERELRALNEISERPDLDGFNDDDFPEPQGEPSDAEVLKVFEDEWYRLDGVTEPERHRRALAALRAAWEVR